jgi:DNA recombination protein RmuC
MESPVPYQDWRDFWPWLGGVTILIVLLLGAAVIAPSFIAVFALLLGLTFGATIGILIASLDAKARRARLEAEARAQAAEKGWIVNWTQASQQKMTDALARSEAVFEAHASRALNALNEQARAALVQLEHESRAHANDFVGRLGANLSAHAAQIGSIKTSFENNLNHLDGSVHASLAQLNDQARANATEVSSRIGTQLTTHAGQLGVLKESIETHIGSLATCIRDLEVKREGAYQHLTAHVTALQTAYVDLREQTAQLINALKAGPVRGRWGEIQLRRIVELSGMTEHVDFNEQPPGIDGRPDLLVRLPNLGRIPVDSKFPLQCYLDAIMSTDAGLREQKLLEHAKSIRQRVKELSQKRYWDQFQPSPELVIMFVPIESSLMVAYEHDPEIVEYALSQKVLLASPITLLGFLRAIAHGWQQFVISRNAIKVLEEGKNLYQRLAKWMEHYRTTGKKIGAAVEAYNSSVASLQTRFLPAARRFKELMAIQDTDEQTDVSAVSNGTNLPPNPEDLEEEIARSKASASDPEDGKNVSGPF